MVPGNSPSCEDAPVPPASGTPTAAQRWSGGMPRALVLGAILLACTAGSVTAQTTTQPLQVQLHVAAEANIKSSALGYLTAVLRLVADVEISERDADYVLSLVILPMSPGGYAVSAVVMNVYSDRRLEELSQRWSLSQNERDRVRAVFKGAGALLDQRVITGPDLKTLCDDVARGVNTDVFATERRARNQQ